jgi:glycosyltransferase involved in cell wall biosynthesis
VKVLFVNHTGSVSGGERSLMSLVDGLRERGVDCTLACPDEGPLRGLAAEHGLATVPVAGTDGSLKLHPLGTPRALGQMGLATIQVARHARRLGADVIHANSIRAGLIAGPAGRLSRTPSVAHLRDRLPPGRVADASLKLIGATCTAIVANSRFTAEGLTRAGVDRPAAVVYNPIDLDLFGRRYAEERQRARAELGLSADSIALGVVGQITPWKGQDTALATLAQIADRRPSARLLLVGEAKFVGAATRHDNRAYLAELEAMAARPSLAGRVEFLGERADVPALMSALDALLVPSWEEPFGRVVVEAMAAGIPVIATSRGGTAEIVADGVNGLLAPPREAGAWAAAIERLLDEPGLRQKLVEGGLRRASDFGIAAHAEAIAEVYASALDRTIAPL